jgi:hypothetical protein
MMRSTISAVAYGFEVVGIQGISTESEAGLARIADLVDMLVAREHPRGLRRKLGLGPQHPRPDRGGGGRGHEVVIGGELYSDAMGAEGTYEGTYVGMIDHNVDRSPALGGDGARIVECTCKLTGTGSIEMPEIALAARDGRVPHRSPTAPPRRGAVDPRADRFLWREAGGVLGRCRRVPAAAMSAIIGPNGAGKSTMLKAVLGIVPRLSGRFRCSATDRRDAPPPRLCAAARQRGLGFSRHRARRGADGALSPAWPDRPHRRRA